MRALVLLIALLPSFDTNRRNVEPRVTKRPWADFRVGSFAAYKLHQMAGGAAFDIEYRMTLLELTSEKAVIDTEMSFSGTKTSHRQELPHNQSMMGVVPAGKPVKKGVETITVGGRAIRCVVIEMESDVNGQAMVTKTWQSDLVPGLNVKMTMKGAAMDYTMELTEFESKK